ncbi:cell wall anchor protein [Pelomyxa schiedti]|nr:cell wall anchor protein [Pelomyxa schiedti]
MYQPEHYAAQCRSACVALTCALVPRLGAYSQASCLHTDDIRLIHAVLLRERAKATPFLWGQNTDSQLGCGSVQSPSTPWKAVLCNSYSCSALSALGMCYWGFQSAGRGGRHVSAFPEPMQPDIPIGSQVTLIAAGGRTTVAQLANNDLYIWGQGARVRVGFGGKVSFVGPSPKVTAISCGSSFFVLQVDSGVVYSCGSNEFGQLGVNSFSPHSELIQVSSEFLPLNKKITAIGCGYAHTVLQLDSMEIVVWGANEGFQLALSDFTAYFPSPTLLRRSALLGKRILCVAGGQGHTAVTLESGELYAWGKNTCGQLGTGDFLDRLTPEWIVSPVFLGRRVSKVSCGLLHTVAYCDTNNTLYVWGDNSQSQFGAGYEDQERSAVPQPLKATPRGSVELLTCGAYHTAALLW